MLQLVMKMQGKLNWLGLSNTGLDESALQEIAHTLSKLETKSQGQPIASGKQFTKTEMY